MGGLGPEMAQLEELVGLGASTKVVRNRSVVWQHSDPRPARLLAPPASWRRVGSLFARPKDVGAAFTSALDARRAAARCRQLPASPVAQSRPEFLMPTNYDKRIPMPDIPKSPGALVSARGETTAKHHSHSTNTDDGAKPVRASRPVRVFRGAASLAAIGGVLLTLVAGASAHAYQTGVYGGEVKISPGKFTIVSWIMSETCHPHVPGAEFSINSNRRAGLPAFSGKVLPSGELRGTGHDGLGIQIVKGRITGTKMTITLIDTGPVSTGAGSPICHGQATEHLVLNGWY